MRHLDLCSGIGGFALAARWARMQTVGFSEVDVKCCKVLAKQFPEVWNYGDIRRLDGRTIYADLVTAGPPCQPSSIAGKRYGAKDHRWLWQETLRVLFDIQPQWAVFESPCGLATLNGGLEFAEVLSALEAHAYEVAPPFVIPACGVGAEHERYRLWLIAYTSEPRGGRLSIQPGQEGCAVSLIDGGAQALTDPNRDIWNTRQNLEAVFALLGDRHTGSAPLDARCRLEGATEPGLLRAVHGLSRRMDRDRIKALGNAIVPQLAYVILDGIMQIQKRGKPC